MINKVSCFIVIVYFGDFIEKKNQGDWRDSSIFSESMLSIRDEIISEWHNILALLNLHKVFSTTNVRLFLARPSFIVLWFLSFLLRGQFAILLSRVTSC